MNDLASQRAPAGRPVTATERWLQRIGRCDVLPYRIRKKLVCAFRDYRRGADRPFRIDFHGLAYTGNLNSFIDWSVFFFGGYEKHILTFMERVARTQAGCVFVDVGANVGQHSLFMSRLAARVHAVEPWQEAVEVLRRQLRDNDIANVTVHEFALGPEDSVARYYPPGDGNHGVGSFVAEFASDRQVEPIDYPMRQGSAFIEECVVPVHLVKIDTEGFEQQVLQGLREALFRHRPCVVVELAHGMPGSIPDLESLRGFLPRDYRLFGIKGVHNGYRYRLCELTPANWREFLDVVAMPPASVADHADALRRYPFYAKPADLPRIAFAWLTRSLRG